MKQFILIFLVLLPVCAFAQFTETFDGPEINSVNPWRGDLDKFVINSDDWLQLDAPLDQKHAEISVPISYSNNIEWVFDVKLLFEPTNSNCVRIYVYTDKQTIPNINDDYYIQIGSNDRDITLRRLRETEKSPKKLITGSENLLKNATNSLRIKLILVNLKEWQLYSKVEGETAYRLQGNCPATVSSLNKGGWFKIHCVYSQTRANLFYFDNINVSTEITETPEEPDLPEPSPVELPQLKAIEVLTASSLQFVFDKAVNIDTAVFSISEIGKAISCSFADDSKTIVNTLFEEEMKVDNYYTISYSGITDLSGNILADYSEKLFLEKEDEEEGPVNVSSGAILINEIMADPKGLKDFPETEYVELYNTTENNITLSNWQFSYGGKAKLMRTFELPAKSYAVLYRSGRNIEIDPSALQVPLDNFPSSLANNGKQLQLLNASGTIIDEVTYAKAKPAKSWERSPSGDWHLSSDPRGGTPGYANSSGEEDTGKPDKPVNPEEPVNPDKPDPDKPSVPAITVEPGEFIFNELLPNPFTGGSEYIELYNRSNRALPVSGLSVAVRKADGTLNTRYPLSSVAVTVEPDGYVLLTKNLSGVTDFYTIQSPSSLFEVSKLPILANTLSTLVLFRTTDQAVIDEVSYSSKWHASSIKDQKGVALERIDPEQETQSASNWTSASASSGYGTPGYHNSQSGLQPDNPDDPDAPDEPTGIEAPQWDESAGHYTISYYLDQPGYNCRAFVFNLSGQRVAQIANHELLGMTGKLIWDGGALSGRQLQTGVYIFYAEIYHVNGTVKSYKQVFLVR